MTQATGRTRRSPDGVWATGGAVHQHDGKLPIYICNTCEAEVVWATSKRTGRKYLVNISHGANGWRYYVGANVHDCGRVLKYKADLSASFGDDNGAADARYDDWAAEQYVRATNG